MIINRFFTRIGYTLREGITGVFANGFMSFASIFVIAACLLITGAFYLLAINIEAIVHSLEDQNKILVFVDEKYTDEEARALQSALESITNVTSARFISRQEAMDSFVAQLENDNKLLGEITADIFRDRFEISLSDIAATEDTQHRLISVPGIVKINAYLEVSRGFVVVRSIVTTVSLALIVLLSIVSVFMMANTIRITTFARRDEIAIMRIVGATTGFIRQPFIIEGLILGLFGSSIGYLALWALYTLAEQQMSNMAMFSFVQLLPFGTISLEIAEIFGGIGVLIGAGGSTTAIRNYLKV